MRVLAELVEGLESETPYGGRAVSWEPVGSAWLKPGPGLQPGFDDLRRYSPGMPRAVSAAAKPSRSSTVT